MKSHEDSIGFLLADVSRLLRRTFQDNLTNSELTQAQARALVYLMRNQGIRQVDLAELLNVQPITLARVLDQLAESGLIERRPDPQDRRAHRLYLLPAADAHIQSIEAVAKVVRSEALAGFNEDEIQALLTALNRVRRNLTN